MISIKDYADSKGVSTQVVYKQIKHHEKVLEGLIVTVNRTRFLTDEAIEYLNSQREQTPSVILQADSSDRIKELEDENHNLLIKIAELQDNLVKKSDMIIELQQEKVILLEKKDDQPKGIWHRLFGK